MFKLSIEFASIAALSAFVTKMGGDVMGGTVTHDQPLDAGTVGVGAEVLTPAQKAAKTKAEKKAAAQTTPVNSAPQTQSAPLPFPGGFGPGAAPQPAPQLANPAPAVGPASAPSVAPMAQTQVAAPAPAPAPQPAPVAQVQVSPERQQYNNNCAQLITYLEQGGAARGYTQEQLGGVISNAFAEAGLTGIRITEMSDAQMTHFYPILHKHVLHAVPAQQ